MSKPQGAGSGADLYNIYDYMDEGGNSYNPESTLWNSDPEKDNSYNTGFYSNERKENGDVEAWLKANGIKYTLDDDWRAGEAGQGAGGKKTLNIDWGSAPQTKFGPVNMTAPVTYKDGTPIQGREALDKRYVYDDPNYGTITHAQNINDKQNPFFQYAGPAIMAAAGWGLGQLGAMPTLASGLVKGAAGYGNGGGLGSLAGTAINAIGSGFGLPSWVGNAAGMATRALLPGQKQPSNYAQLLREYAQRRGG